MAWQSEVPLRPVGRMHDVFFWSLLHDNEAIAQAVWPKCSKPVHVALLGAAICKAMARYDDNQKLHLLSRADRLESWASGTLDNVPNKEMAHSVISMHLIAREHGGTVPSTAVDIAIGTKSKFFLSKKYLSSLCDLWWRGGFDGSETILPDSFSWTWLVLQAFVPVINPYYFWRVGQEQAEKNNGPGDQSLFFEALGVANRIAAKEREAHRLSTLKAKRGGRASRAASGGRSTERHNASPSRGSPLCGSPLRGSPSRGSPFRGSPLLGALARVQATVGLVEESVRGLRGARSPRNSSRRSSELDSSDSHRSRRPSAADSDGQGGGQGRRGSLMHSSSALVAAMAASQLDGRIREAARTRWRLVVSFYNVPAVKFAMQAAVHLTSMATYFLLIFEVFRRTSGVDGGARGPESMSAIELIWVCLEIGNWMDRLYARMMLITHKFVPREVAMSSVRIASYCGLVLSNGLTIAAFACRMVQLSLASDLDDDAQQVLYDAYQVLVSIKAGEKVIASFRFLSEHRPFGVLVITLYAMAGDVANFSIIFLLITIAFNVMLVGMQYAGMFNDRVQVGNFSVPTNPFDSDGAASLPWWAVFGEFQPDLYNPLVAAVTWIYSFIACIVLVNLLVAMLSSTFDQVRSASEVEYSFLKWDRLFKLRHTSTGCPPVLNAPFILWCFCNYGYKKCRKCFRASRRFVHREDRNDAADEDEAELTDRLMRRSNASVSSDDEPHGPPGATGESRDSLQGDGRFYAAQFLQKQAEAEASTVAAISRQLLATGARDARQQRENFLQLANDLALIETRRQADRETVARKLQRIEQSVRKLDPNPASSDPSPLPPRISRPSTHSSCRPSQRRGSAQPSARSSYAEPAEPNLAVRTSRASPVLDRGAVQTGSEISSLFGLGQSHRWMLPRSYSHGELNRQCSLSDSGCSPHGSPVASERASSYRASQADMTATDAGPTPS